MEIFVNIWDEEGAKYQFGGIRGPNVGNCRPVGKIVGIFSEKIWISQTQAYCVESFQIRSG